MAPGREAMHIAHEGDEGGGGQEADPGDREQTSDDGGLAGERGQLAFHGVSPVFELTDLGAALGERGSEGVGKNRVGVLQEGLHVGEDVARPQRYGDPELAEEPAEGVDPGRAGGEPGGAEAMQGREGLLGDGLDRNGADRVVAESFEEALGVGAVGLIARDVGPDGVGWEQNHAVPEGLELAAPVVSGPAGLEQDGRGLAFGEERDEARAAEPVAFADVPRSFGDGDLEDGLRQIDGDRWMIHDRLLLSVGSDQ